MNILGLDPRPAAAVELELHSGEEETDGLADRLVTPFSFFNKDFAMFAQINSRRGRAPSVGR